MLLVSIADFLSLGMCGLVVPENFFFFFFPFGSGIVYTKRKKWRERKQKKWREREIAVMYCLFDFCMCLCYTRMDVCVIAFNRVYNVRLAEDIDGLFIEKKK